MAADQKVATGARLQCLSFSAWSTIVSIVIVTTLVAVHIASASSFCGSETPLSCALEKVAWTGAKLPDASSLQGVCSKVHDITSACLLLSGEIPSPGHAPTSLAGRFWNAVAGVRNVAHGQPAGARIYGRDMRDVLFAFTWGVILYAVRGVLLATVLVPLGRLLVERPSPDAAQTEKGQRQFRKNVTRFAEQGWILILYSASFALVCVRIALTSTRS